MIIFKYWNVKLILSIINIYIIYNVIRKTTISKQ